jgi:hypothetical protein
MAWRDRLVARRHTALLTAIVVAFAIRPVIGDSGVSPVLFSLAMLVVLMLGVYAVQFDDLVGDPAKLRARRQRRRLAIWVLAVPALLERLVMIVAPNPRLYLAGTLCWLVFFLFVTWVELSTVLEQREVTDETISMAVSVYLLMGLSWGLLYLALFLYHPQAFSFEHFPGAEADPTRDPQNALPTLIYFSLSTLSTLGFGDIMPVSMQARYLAVAEGIAGQLFLAILVARLVSLRINSHHPGVH